MCAEDLKICYEINSLSNQRLLSHVCVSLLTGYAIPAVNCVSSSGINACLEAARKNNAPVIIQFSSGGSQVSGNPYRS